MASLGTAQAQNQFDPVALADGSIITEFEVEQRILFLQTLNAPGSTRPEVIKELINERLRTAATQQVGVTLSAEQLEAGLAQFAARADLNTDEFIAGLEQNGVAGETLRDYLASQILWRDFSVPVSDPSSRSAIARLTLPSQDPRPIAGPTSWCRKSIFPSSQKTPSKFRNWLKKSHSAPVKKSFLTMRADFLRPLRAIPVDACRAPH
ncbi:MAG: hypothetical protein ABJK89_00875 [Paracoccaceae bacterium]